jgi:hypothetical protein
VHHGGGGRSGERGGRGGAGEVTLRVWAGPGRVLVSDSADCTAAGLGPVSPRIMLRQEARTWREAKSAATRESKDSPSRRARMP